MFIPPYRRKRIDEEYKLKKKPLVYDGVGKYTDECRICGTTDMVFPLNTAIMLCAHCYNKAYFRSDEVFPISNGRCALCNKDFYYGGVLVRADVRVCIKCLWYKLGKHGDRLTVAGSYIC